jgi:hypothetical protein
MRATRGAIRGEAACVRTGAAGVFLRSAKARFADKTLASGAHAQRSLALLGRKHASQLPHPARQRCSQPSSIITPRACLSAVLSANAQRFHLLGLCGPRPAQPQLVLRRAAHVQPHELMVRHSHRKQHCAHASRVALNCGKRSERRARGTHVFAGRGGWW